MKAITMTEISRTTLWSSNNDTHGHCHHYSSHGWKSSSQRDLFRPVTVNDENLNFKSSSNKLNRSLFGQSDPLETKRLLYEQMNSRRIIDRNRWNFDFHTEKPLQGRYEWHKLTRSDTSPPQSPFDRRTPSPKFFSNHYQDANNKHNNKFYMDQRK
ncbi:uncharacterized protein LOC124494199 isoform X2 [Dermatophagoides farinae]|uniref:uncharacterized protein LOC124494199 isoform X2 n=1 Tax=Dermatophagoides farinae TaxID=6954 RepID=UPI003F5F3580